jgi:hypothetical protein
VDYIPPRSDLVRSAYTRGAVVSRLVDWNDLLEQPGAALPPDADPTRPGNVRRKAAAYRALPREQQVRVLLEWLPDPLRRAPRIDWDRVPSKSVAYLLYGRAKDRPDRVHLGLLAGVAASNGVLGSTVYHQLTSIVTVWDHLRSAYQLEDLAEIAYEQWMDFGSDPNQMRRFAGPIHHYQAASAHMREYFQLLSADVAKELVAFRFPELPTRFTERFIPITEFRREAEERRKAKTDVLVPLTTTLVALILERKKAAHRFIEWFRAQVAAANAGSLPVPAELEYRDYELDVNRDAQRVEDVRWIKRPVYIRCTIWEPRPYTVHHHQKRWIAKQITRGIRRQKLLTGHDWIYDPDLRERYFLELHGSPSEDPWFLSIVRRGVLLSGNGVGSKSISGHSGLATPSHVMAHWLWRQRELFRRATEPEALYRGVLFGSALAILALTSEARQGELVQISVDRFESLRPYIVKDDAGNPVINPATGRPRYSVIVLQRLLPKGRRHDSERNRYNVSAAASLLDEITEAVRERHDGRIPLVPPRRTHTKIDDLRPEHYLLQWNKMVINGDTVNGLIRFLVDGLEFRDLNSHPFKVSTHLLRHVGATAARHEFGLPLDILGHTMDRDGHAPSATSYYTRMPLEERIVEQQRAIDRMLEKAEAATREIVAIDPAEEISRLIQRSEQRTRDVLERWHTYHPVVFGHCGRAGLCVRGTSRVLCLGCPFLNPRPEFMHRVETYQRAYEQMAEHLEASGNLAEAREHQRLAQHCRTLKREMELLGRAEASGRWAPPGTISEAANTGSMLTDGSEVQDEGLAD